MAIVRRKAARIMTSKVNPVMITSHLTMNIAQLHLEDLGGGVDKPVGNFPSGFVVIHKPGSLVDKCFTVFA